MPPTLPSLLPSDCELEISTAPIVAFIECSAARAAGWTSDLSTSVPIENGAKPAATPTALPEEEPAGFCHDKQWLPFQVSADTDGVAQPLHFRINSAAYVRGLCLDNKVSG